MYIYIYPNIALYYSSKYINLKGKDAGRVGGIIF